MSENKQQKLLQELDESWQGLAAEKPTFDRALAQQLLSLAADQKPEATFRADARAALLQAARRQAAEQRQREAQPAPKPTFWQEINSLWGMRNENMKRLAYVGGLAALFMVLVAVFWQFRPVDEIVDYDPVETPAGSAELAELPQLPRLGAGVAPASGLGGGGNVTADAAAVPAPGLIEETSILRYYSVFSGTEFILAATLPTDINAAEVYSQSGGLELTVEMAQALAAQMGFTGTLYTTPQPADVAVSYPLAYLAFQDGARLTIDPYGSISFERIGLVEQPFTGFATAADLAVAEQFAVERGLLPLPYEVAVTPWGEVGFYPVINGQRLDQMLGSARVIDGQVAFLYLQWRMEWQSIGAYPLLAPATAWEQLLAQINEPDNEIPYEIRPAGFGQDGSIGVAEPPVGIEPMQYWQRDYLPGERVTVYLYPSVLIALDGSAPIVETWPLALEADEATRYALAETPFQLTRFTGTINATGDGIVVDGFEILPTTADPFRFAEGTVNRVAEEVFFTSTEGEIYILPNVPADLADGTDVYVYGWQTDEMAGDIPVFNWENIEVRFEFEEMPVGEEPMPVEPLPIDPGAFAPVYAQVTITKVTLGYRYVYVFSDPVVEGEMVIDVAPAGPPAFYIQPVWQFAGVTDSGDLVTFYVQAVAPAYVE